MTIKGTRGNDVLTGTAGDDVFILDQGGNDHVSGGDGNDIFKFGGAFTAKDIVDGGSGINTLSLAGDYSGDHRVIFHPATLTNIQNIVLGAHHSYSMASNDAAVAAGATLTIDASRLQAGDTFRFNAKHDHDGDFNLIGGAGNDVLGGASQADTFDISHGGDDLVRSGSGDDIIHAGAQFTAADTIDAGAGNDTLVLDGDYSAGLTLGANTIAKVETLSLAAGNNYSLTTNDANVSSGGTLAVDASALGAGNSLHFDGSAETNGSFAITGGAGDDTVTLSSSAVLAASTLDGGAGDDTVNLAGDFSGGASAHLSGVETIVLASADTYNLIVNDDGTLDGNKLTIDASALGSADNVDIGAATMTADIHFIDGAGQNILDSGTGNDTFDLTQGHYDSVHGGGGDDVFNFAANFGGFSYVHGDAGNDTVNFDGDYASLAIDNSANLFEGIETIAFGGGHAYNNVIVTGDVSGGALTLDASAASSISIDLSNATSSAVNFTGSAGDDSVTVADQNLLAASTFDGGAGNDTLVLDGDYSAGLTLGANTIANVETLNLAAGHDYSLTTNDANVSSGGTLTVDASALGAGNSLHFDGSAETNGSFAITGGAGGDTVTFGNASALAASTFDGGAGHDTLILNGDFSGGFTFQSGTIASVENLNFAGGHDYSITMDNNIATGGILVVDSQSLAAGDSLTFDGSAETDGRFTFLAGNGLESLKGSTQADGFAIVTDNPYNVNDTFDGGAGFDTFNLLSLSNYTFSFGADTIHNIERVILSAFAPSAAHLVMSDGSVAAGQTLTVDAGTLDATSSLNLDASAETDGSYAINGGAGDDTVTLGSSTVLAASTFDGGAGNDTLVLNGDFSSGVILDGASYSGIEAIQATESHDYNLTLMDNLVAAGTTLEIDGGTISSGHSLNVDGSAETDGILHMTGGAGDDSLTGGAQGDIFDISQGGHDTVSGGGGDDAIISSGTGFDAGDKVDGGSGFNSVALLGDYSGGLTLGAATMTNIEEISFQGAFNYALTTNDATVAAGQTLYVGEFILPAAQSLTFDGSAETDGHFFADLGAAQCDITGGAISDSFQANAGGSNGFNTADAINGGAGNDSLSLSVQEATSLTFTDATIQSVETLILSSSGTSPLSLTMADGNVAAGTTLSVFGIPMSSSSALTFDGSAETDGSYAISGGAGNDSLTGGALADTLSGGGGADMFVYANAGHSSGNTYDTITDLNFSEGDQFNLLGGLNAPSAIDAAVNGGALSGGAGFDTDLAAAVGAGQLGANHAVTFTADSGSLANHTFLVIDENGTAGYQSGADIVIDITGYTGTLSTSAFLS